MSGFWRIDISKATGRLEKGGIMGKIFGRFTGRQVLYLALLLALFLLDAGCGRKENGADRRSLVGLTIRREERQVTVPEGRGTGYQLGRQFYQGEAVQIWGEKNSQGKLDICLYREDGGKEELLGGAPMEYGECKWFLDRDGNRFLMSQGRDSGLIRLDAEGGELYRRQGDMVEDMTQLSDGRLLLILWEGDNGRRLAELDPDTGIMQDVIAVELARGNNCFIGAGKEGLHLLNQEGLYTVDLRQGDLECIMPFDGAYSPGNGVQDFQVLEDGKLEVLQSGGRVQTLELYDPVGDREIILVRRPVFQSEIKKFAVLFNQSNEKYYVYLEESPEGVDRVDFGARTLVELGIICAPLLEQPWQLIQNGYLEDLAPWIKESGIREKDYFPAAFSRLRDGERIYGINISVSANLYSISREVLGENTDPDIGELVEALRNYDKEGVFESYGARRILLYFLEGSEDLWGMVDWEGGKCDFGGGLFAGMLEAAKRYADDGKGIRPVIATYQGDFTYYDYDYVWEQLEEQGMEPMGYFYDDGRHPESSSAIWMAVNSRSPVKEGAWEFLQFLLSEQVQFMDNIEYPVYKDAFLSGADNAISQGAFVFYDDETSQGGKTMGNHAEIFAEEGYVAYRELFDPTEEKVEKVKVMLEDARFPPLRTEGILNIICEEAEEYFSGTKSIEEVTAVIQNRVQLYMDEH